MGERSLSALFSKLDREQELEWLAERPGVQRVLSHVLRVPLEEVRAVAAPERAAEANDVRRVRLRDLRFARALDLVAERLCPGVPEVVLEPGAYRAFFWHAPSGSGRSLVGRFLEVRGRARFIVAKTWEQALAALPAQGPAFIELTHPPSAPLPKPPRRDLCVAAPFLPGSSDWELVESPRVSSFLEPLVAWVATRLPSDGRFDPERTLLWFRRELEPSGALDSLGSVLGFCGLSDELGMSALRGKSAGELAARIVRERVAATIDPEAPNASWLKKHAFELLLGIGRRMLTDSDLPWDTARSFDEWLALVPSEHQRGADLDWLQLSLGSTDVSIRPADVERAARKIPPGAFRIVRTLERAGLIVGADGELALGPRWLSSSLRLEARRSLVSGSPLEWGEALLRAHAAPLLADELAARIPSETSAFVERVLELEGGGSAAHCAAVELAFRAVGSALLGGQELGQDLLEPLWNDALELVCELDDELPRARIEYPPGHASHALLTPGAYYLAALAVSAELGQRAGKRHPVLRPWQLDQPGPALARLCDAIERDLTDERSPPAWQLGVYAIVQRVRAELGGVVGEGALHPLERPAVILEEVVHDVLSWATVRGIHAPASALAGLFALADARRVAQAELARAIWRAWDEAGRPSDGADFLQPDAAARAWFWPHIPGELLASLLADGRSDAPYDLFGEEQWQAVLSALERAELPHASAALLEHASDALLQQLLDRAALTPALFASLWRRAPERALSELGRELAERTPDATRLVRLLDAAPQSALPALCAACEERSHLHDLPAPKLAALRRFLHGLVRARSPSYRAAYALLRRIDTDLGRARPIRSDPA